MEKDLNSTETISIRGEKLYLLPEKAIFWPKKQSLLIADLHLGKTNHFRKGGFAVPKDTPSKNWETLQLLFKKYHPKRVCFLGDLFHSAHNKEWKVFSDLIGNYSSIQFELVVGNHDVLKPEMYLELGFEVHTEFLIDSPFILSHEPIEAKELYNLAGHIHPGVRLTGIAKQSLKAPCFYFGKQQGILPAFGSFTGLSQLPIKKEDRVFIIAAGQVIPMSAA